MVPTRSLLVPLLVSAMAACFGGCGLDPIDYTGKACPAGECPQGFVCVAGSCLIDGTDSGTPDAGPRSVSARLFSPLTLRNVVIRNRVLSTGHQTYLARDGMVFDNHYVMTAICMAWTRSSLRAA